MDGLDGDAKIDALAWCTDHLPRKRAQDHLGWRYEHYQHLQLAVLESLVVAYMRADVPACAQELISGSRGYIVDKPGSPGEARVVCAVLSLRRVAERCAMFQDREAFAEDKVCLPGGLFRRL